ncbi:hypothetical protein Tco_0341053 [Tanacetum coccineum]
MDAPTIPVFVDSSEGNFGDAIDIGLDVDHPIPVAADAFPIVTIVTILASLGEAIQGIHEYLQGVPIEEEMRTLRYWEAIQTVLIAKKRRTHGELERIVGLPFMVQESQRQDQENFRKLQELVTSQLGRHP